MTDASPAPDWYAADAAYRLHHFNCAICGARQRCPDGQALWDTYNPWLQLHTP
ncbi:hypothetical protein [Paracidovorax citrulli]|uniref:hypothetical protein n=1 Tax=Paracidovorax citrulli TaxID=80869 RepID=UPI001364931F|nr:hypothetical protein [Paracidovorax citrulli]